MSKQIAWACGLAALLGGVRSRALALAERADVWAGHLNSSGRMTPGFMPGGEWPGMMLAARALPVRPWTLLASRSLVSGTTGWDNAYDGARLERK